MRKSVVAGLAMVSIAAGAAWAAESLREPAAKVSGPLTQEQVRSLLGTLVPPSALPDDAENYRKPILKAAGTQPVAPGQERITIPVDGVAYEVVVTKPGMGTMIPLDH